MKPGDESSYQKHSYPSINSNFYWQFFLLCTKFSLFTTSHRYLLTVAFKTFRCRIWTYFCISRVLVLILFIKVLNVEPRQGSKRSLGEILLKLFVEHYNMQNHVRSNLLCGCQKCNELAKWIMLNGLKHSNKLNWGFENPWFSPNSVSTTSQMQWTEDFKTSGALQNLFLLKGLMWWMSFRPLNVRWFCNSC